MRNQKWANYIKEKRKTKHLTRRKLAQLGKIDPSYITLIERDGYVPRREKVQNLSRALEVDANEILLMAGYAPDGIPPRELLQKMESNKLEESLIDEMVIALKEIGKLQPKEQKEVAKMITAFVNVMKEKSH